MTNEEKQIEELAEDIKEILVRNFDKTNLYHWVTKDLYTKGYRKASDVAKEIFAEIEQAIENTAFLTYWHEGGFRKRIRELKKKYESEDDKDNDNDNK